MAPSRALYRAVTACAHRNPQRLSPRLLSTIATAATPAARLSTLRPTLSRPVTCFPASRTYSQQAGVDAPAVAEEAGPQPPEYLSEGELHVFNKIKAELEPVKLEVQDISGGCGSMYALDIESAKFKGLTVIKQHKLVNQVLKEEIAQWHGVQLKTRAP